MVGEFLHDDGEGSSLLNVFAFNELWTSKNNAVGIFPCTLNLLLAYLHISNGVTILNDRLIVVVDWKNVVWCFVLIFGRLYCGILHDSLDVTTFLLPYIIGKLVWTLTTDTLELCPYLLLRVFLILHLGAVSGKGSWT